MDGKSYIFLDQKTDTRSFGHISILIQPLTLSWLNNHELIFMKNLMLYPVQAPVEKENNNSKKNEEIMPNLQCPCSP